VMNDLAAAIYDTKDSGYYGGYKYRYGENHPADNPWGFLTRLKEGVEAVSQRQFRKPSVTSAPTLVRDEPPVDNIIRNVTQCVECAKSFVPARSDARFCSSACRQKAYRARKGRQTA